MDNPPGRHIPTNFNIFDFFFGSQSAHSLVYHSNQNLKDKKSSMNIDDSYFTSKTMVNNLINSNNKMNLIADSKDTSDKNSSDEKKSNTRVTGMIGGVIDALTNVVAKITNFTSTVNRSLSVTVVPQESFSTDYVVRPLTDDENFTNTDDSTLINSTRRYQNYMGKSHTMEAFNNLSPQRISDDTRNNNNNNNNNNYNMWSDNTHDYYYHQQMNASLLYSQHAPDIQMAIEDNFKVNKKQFKPVAPEYVQQMDNNQLNSQYIKDLALAMEESLKTIKINYKPRDSKFVQSETKIQGKMITVPGNKNLSNSDDPMESDNDYVDLSAEQIFETKSRLSKKRSKPNNRNVVAQSLGKNRRRIALRQSTAGQMKHRKEKSKNVIYSAIQNDLNTWEDNIIDSSDELRSIISSSDEDENKDDQKKFSLNFENFIIVEKCALGDPPIDININTSTISKDVVDKNLSESFNHSNERVPPVTQDYQQSRLPESSVKYQDSLVHIEDLDKEESESEIETESESESESETESESSGESESEIDFDDDDDDDDDDIVFDDNDDVDGCDHFSDDDFIQFGTEVPRSTNKKVRFNLEPTVHTIITWDFAYRAARKGPWEQMVRDRDRFRTRIYSTGRVIEPVLATQHRDCIWKDRFAATD